MEKKRFFLYFTCILICFFQFTLGCSSAPILKMPESMVPNIKEYKHFKLYGSRAGLISTGIYLGKGDIYSVLASGNVHIHSKSHSLRSPSDVLLSMIGKNPYFSTFYQGENAKTSISSYSGNLCIGISDGGINSNGHAVNPNWYNNNAGFFNVAVIVWEKDDYVQIAKFFEKMKGENPENKALIDAFNEVNQMKKIFLAKEETSKEIEKTKIKIQELRKKTEKGKKQTNKSVQGKKTSTIANPPLIKPDKQAQVVQLEAKLLKLTKVLDELKEMKKRFEIERDKSNFLAKELEKKMKKENILLNKIAGGIINPPVLVIVSPKKGKRTESKNIQLAGVAEDDQGLKLFEILVNNKLLNKDDVRGIKVIRSKFSKRIEFNECIPLKKGVNQIKIRAIDSEGLLSEKVITVHNIERRRNIWAVVIGINDYQNISKLKYAVNDAKAFYKLLVDYNKIPERNVTLLLNHEASLSNLRSALGTKIKNVAGKEDMAIIYFAGHGATERDAMSPDGDGLEKYLLPYNADLKDLYSSALPMREISYILNRIKSERLVFIADSCYSGASGGRTVSFSGNRSNISDAFLERITSGKGKVIITASSANEVSAENEELQHGVFTHYLLEGLRGKADTDNDGLVSADEVYSYVSEKVPQATCQEQHPVKKGSVKGHLILSIVQ